MVAPHKGVPAADESTGSTDKHLPSIGTEHGEGQAFLPPAAADRVIPYMAGGRPVPRDTVSEGR